MRFFKIIIHLINSYLCLKYSLIDALILFSYSPNEIINTLINTLKVNIGLSLVGVISGEFLVSKGGLGYLIVYGGQVFKLDLVMTSVIVLGIVAALMYKIITLIEKLVLNFIMHK